MNWYKIANSPKMIVTSYNSYGDMTILIGEKQYKYVNVNQVDYDKLEYYIRANNKSAAFKLIKLLKQEEPKKIVPKKEKQLKMFNKEDKMTKEAEEKKVLFLLRAPSGSGKSTLAKELAGTTGKSFEADEYFMKNGKYIFDVNLLGRAHQWNEQRAREAMKNGVSPVVIANTNTKLFEMKPYILAAKEYGYEVHFKEPNWSPELKTQDGKWNVDFLAKLQQNKDRADVGKTLDRSIIERQTNRFQYQNPDETDEQFAQRIIGQ